MPEPEDLTVDPKDEEANRQFNAELDELMDELKPLAAKLLIDLIQDPDERELLLVELRGLVANAMGRSEASPD